MEYISSRGGSEPISSKEAIINGLAGDGGLYVPERIPEVNIKKLFKHSDYRDLASSIMKLYFTDFTEVELATCIARAYDSKFSDALVAPLVKVDDYYVLELFHGATSAFKDMALSILPQLLTTAAKSKNIDEDILILTATSGDTGKAALEGFADVEGCRIIVFYPNGGVSEIQRRQMLTQKGKNTSVIGVNGNFDDAQTGVKNIFSDEDLSAYLLENGYRLSSANSINIGRLVPQIVYYFHAYFQLVRSGEISLGDKVDFTVPTGNFGNILAGFYAKNMGLPVGKLVVASNDNKVLVDFFEDGKYDKNRKFKLTTSPSMDILVSSNLERLLYHKFGDKKTRGFMEGLAKEGIYFSDVSYLLDDFVAGFANMDEVNETIVNTYLKSAYIADPHTAVAINVSKKYRELAKEKNAMVVLSTASPYKFPKTVLEAIKKEKLDEVLETKLIDELKELMDTDVPKGIARALKDELKHLKVIEKEDMKAAVLENLSVL